MDPSPPHEITSLLRAWSAGDEEALQKLTPFVIDHEEPHFYQWIEPHVS